MSEILQKPPVVDLDVLLQPISDESPSGESLRYSGIYDQISEARRADDGLNQGDWQSELKVADFRQVIGLAVPALSSQAKDLQIAAWLSEALVREHGFAGLRDSLKLMAGLQESFWETLHPEVDDGDEEGRANAVAWMEAQTAFALKQVPVTDGDRYSFLDWEDSKRFNIPADLESLDYETREKLTALKTQAEKERRVTSDLWEKAKARTRRAFCESANYDLEECRTALSELNRVVEEKFDRNQVPGLNNLSKAIDDVHTLVKRLLEEKRAEEPDPADDAAAAGEGEATNGNGAAPTGGISVGGAVQSRADALKRLAEIAAFLQKTEPHSPVAYLVQRAVKWGNMPLDGWLRDVIKDESVLGALRETLGINPEGDSADSSSSEW
jgi:type VI secretion system protein ImpA